MFDNVILYLLLLHHMNSSPTGHLILDTGKSGDHEESHYMMPMMAHHFNPYSFYPMQHQQSPAPMIHVHPVYIEDHSAMHHHQPESSHHHHEYQHHEEQHYPEHHGMEYQQHEPQQHEMHHQPEQHEEQQYHEQMKQHYPEQEVHHEEESGGHHGVGVGGGYASNPMMQMMMHGSGPQPIYDQLAALQAFHQQALYAGHNFQDPALQQHHQQMMQNFQDQKEQQAQLQPEIKPSQPQPSQEIQQQQQQQQQSNKPTSLFDQAGNNPLVAIIKPIFKRDPNKQKKP